MAAVVCVVVTAVVFVLEGTVAGGYVMIFAVVVSVVTMGVVSVVGDSVVMGVVVSTVVVSMVGNVWIDAAVVVAFVSSESRKPVK